MYRLSPSCRRGAGCGLLGRNRGWLSRIGLRPAERRACRSIERRPPGRSWRRGPLRHCGRRGSRRTCGGRRCVDGRIRRKHRIDRRATQHRRHLGTAHGHGRRRRFGWRWRSRRASLPVGKSGMRAQGNQQIRRGGQLRHGERADACQPRCTVRATGKCRIQKPAIQRDHRREEGRNGGNERQNQGTKEPHILLPNNED